MTSPDPATQPAAPALQIDGDVVLDLLRDRIAELVGRPAAAAMVDAARLEAMTRSLAADNATQAAQLAELRGKTTGPRTGAAG